MTERVDFSTIKPKISDIKTGNTGMSERSRVSKNPASNPVFNNQEQNEKLVQISNQQAESIKKVLKDELNLNFDEIVEAEATYSQ